VRASGNSGGTGPIHLESELDRTLEYLAVGVAAVVNIFNPQAVLLCARLLDLAPDAMKRLKGRVAARALRPLLSGCQIIRAQCDTRQGAVAGIIHHLTRSLGPVIE
jgi:predicted NBD/HSP70 family sugar kinase